MTDNKITLAARIITNNIHVAKQFSYGLFSFGIFKKKKVIAVREFIVKFKKAWKKNYWSK